jgi:hypothetical protein
MGKILLSLATVLLAASFTCAQERPHDQDHKQHSHDGFMQGHMHHAVAKGVLLAQSDDGQKITLRVGPLKLPAHTDHMKMPQPSDLTWKVPISGWLLAYHPKLVDASGGPVPGMVLHHVAFWNESRPDFLCPNKEEHIFGAGSELTDWVEIAGFGYRVEQGDVIRIETMVHNPTATSYEAAYLEVTIPYRDLSGEPVKSVYPAWMDVTACGHSGYDLAAGPSQKTGNVTLKYDGVLLGVGGHMHDYARQVTLEDATRNATVATLDAKLDDKGQLISMPVKTFFEQGGYKLLAGDQLKVTATYDNTTGKSLPDGAMGIVVGYFVPADDAAIARLRRAPAEAAKK